MYFHKKSIYIIQYNNVKDLNDVTVSYGLINNIKGGQFKFSGNINKDSEVSLIFNLANNKLIGFFEFDPNNYYNKGIFFNNIIKDFIKSYKFNHNIKNQKNIKSENNEIDLIIKIGKEDVKKNIYFLDNYQYKDNDNINHYHDNLEELNELNTELYIKDDNNHYKNHKFKKFFNFEKEGEYKIKMKFNIYLKNCSYMFAGCKNIISINCISFNTKYLNNAQYMFYNCENLKAVNLLTFSTKNITDMSYMFSGSRSLTDLDLSSFDTEKVNNMSNMFSDCKSLVKLNISFFNTNNVTNISYMFSGCRNLVLLDLSSFEIKNNNVNKEYFIYYCKNLKKVKSYFIKLNEIHILFDIGTTDINKEIFFLDNCEIGENKFEHGKFTDLNKLNTELYINNKKTEFKISFIPEKEGKYIIKL